MIIIIIIKVGSLEPRGLGMGRAGHSGPVLQCPESGVGQWLVQWGVWRVVCAHQGSILSQLLSILVLEALSHQFHTGISWELLYTDDLVLITDIQEECISKLKAWKVGMGSKGLRVNMKKTKFLVSGDDHYVVRKSCKYPCAVCCSGFGRNSMLCPQYMLWVYKTCRA